MFDYVNSRSTATRLLKKFGKVQKLVIHTPGTYDTETSTIIGASNQENDVLCAHFPVKGETTTNGAAIVVGDEYALVSGADANNIKVSDKLIIDTVTWNIFAVLTVGPAETNVIHRLYIRK